MLGARICESGENTKVLKTSEEHDTLLCSGLLMSGHSICTHSLYSQQCTSIVQSPKPAQIVNNTHWKEQRMRDYMRSMPLFSPEGVLRRQAWSVWDWPDPNSYSKRRRAHLLPSFILCPVSKGATNSGSTHLLFPCVFGCTIPQDPHIFTFPYWTKVQTPAKVATLTI